MGAIRTENNLMQRVYHDPEDSLFGVRLDLQNSSLLDFWMWAFRDLCDDDLKGIFAEWIVLKLLNIPGTQRCSWANNDLVTPSGVTIEVKASAHWQSWKLLDGQAVLRQAPLRPMTRAEKVIFGGLQARDATGIDPKSARTHKSQLYVFAFEHERDTLRWNAMDLTQWEFFILPASKLSGRSIKLSELRRNFKRLSADEFPDEAASLIAALETTVQQWIGLSSS